MENLFDSKAQDYDHFSPETISKPPREHGVLESIGNFGDQKNIDQRKVTAVRPHIRQSPDRMIWIMQRQILDENCVERVSSEKIVLVHSIFCLIGAKAIYMRNWKLRQIPKRQCSLMSLLYTRCGITPNIQPA